MEEKDIILTDQINDTEKAKVRKTKIKTMSSTFRTSEVVILVLLTCIISLGFGFFLHYRMTDETTSDELVDNIDPEIQEFIKNYNNIINNYYKDVDKKELINQAIKGMVDSLDDPYSSYIDESESSNFNILLNGSYEGLGVQIVKDTEGNIIIYKVFEDSPASKAELKPGDILLKINDVDLKDKTTEFFSSYVKTSEVNNFTILYKRGNDEKTVVLKKELIAIKSVFSKIYEEGNKRIGYLGVETFALNTYAQFKAELEKLEKDGIDSLIIDLRDNSGGHLVTVKNMISLFLDTTHVIYQTQDKTEIEKTYSTGSVTKTYPIVILANRQSASASEVMIGALKDEYGATLVGETTYGKGTVQELLSTNSGGQYKITTKKWLTPSGYWVNEKGIKPDVEVVLKEDYYLNPIVENDNQLQSAFELLRK
jgi:carboxyl-terminal processing protease